VASVTSEVSKKEGTATKHKKWLLSILWEHTCHATATVKHSRQCLFAGFLTVARVCRKVAQDTPGAGPWEVAVSLRHI